MRIVLHLAASTAALTLAMAPTPPAQQWTLDAQHFDASRLWSLSTGQGVTVAVVDTGVDANHPDLAGQVLAGADFTSASSDGRIDRSENAHGTSVAAIIAGTGTGPDRVTGLAPDAKILPVRISDTLAGDPAALAQGIYYAATHGAKVINVSICAATLNPQIRTAVEDALKRDIVIVAAAGNDGLITNLPQYPAALPGVIAVAASDSSGNRWPKSESGPYLGLTAPGVDIYTAGSQGGRQHATGTSFAAPQVAATVALLRSRYPQENADQIINRITSTAHLAGQGRNTQWGYGIIGPYQALTTSPAPPTTDSPLLQALAEPPQATAEADSRQARNWTAASAGITGLAALMMAALIRHRLRQRRGSANTPSQQRRK